MNDRPIYYVRMNDVSVRTGVHILSGTDAGIGLYELCFMFLHFLFAHTLNISEPDFVPILVPIFSAYFGLSSTEIGSKSVYSDKGIEKRSYLIKAPPSLFVAISPMN